MPAEPPGGGGTPAPSPHNSRTTPAVPRIFSAGYFVRPPLRWQGPAEDLLVPRAPADGAVVGLPRPDEKSLAGTMCISASDHLVAIGRSSLNDMRVFRPGVRELSGLALVVLLAP